MSLLNFVTIMFYLIYDLHSFSELSFQLIYYSY